MVKKITEEMKTNKINKCCTVKNLKIKCLALSTDTDSKQKIYFFLFMKVNMWHDEVT